MSPKLQAMAAEAGIACRPVGIGGTHAMVVGERYHDPLLKTFLSYKIPPRYPPLIPKYQKILKDLVDQKITHARLLDA